jgi:hypothetical protein
MALGSCFQGLFCHIFPNGWWRYDFPILLHKGNPFLNNSAQFRIDLSLIVPMIARADNPWTLPDKTLIRIRPFDYLDVSRTVLHSLAPWIFLGASRSWSGRHTPPLWEGLDANLTTHDGLHRQLITVEQAHPDEWVDVRCVHSDAAWSAIP